MAFSKAEQFAEPDKAVARMARALAHPARVAILKTLAARNACICGELVDSLPLAQSTVSQHLKALREAGLVIGEIEGPASCYCVNPDAVALLAETFNAFVVTLQPLTQGASCHRPKSKKT